MASGNMASEVTSDQIVDLKTAGIANRDTTKHWMCVAKLYSMYGNGIQTATTSNKPIPGRKRSIRTKPIVQAVI